MVANRERINYCFIDGQNVRKGTTEADPSWRINDKKLRIYLRDKYRVQKAYYFVGNKQEKHYSLYHRLEKSGYILEYKEHGEALSSKKKGNVDVDIVFKIMSVLLDESDKFEKIILISGDGDFKKLVDYLIKKERLEKIIFPNQKRSSLYNKLPPEQYEELWQDYIKKKIAYVR